MRTGLSNPNPINERLEAAGKKRVPSRPGAETRRYVTARYYSYAGDTLARHSGRRGNITFFPPRLSSAPDSNTVLHVCPSHPPPLSPRRDHARPEMTPVGIARDADTCPSCMPPTRPCVERHGRTRETTYGIVRHRPVDDIAAATR